MCWWSGKIQLESANLENGQPKDYSITFIGILGNLKDLFAGKFLKDLTILPRFRVAPCSAALVDIPYFGG